MEYGTPRITTPSGLSSGLIKVKYWDVSVVAKVSHLVKIVRKA